jgi:hypothetical protein
MPSLDRQSTRELLKRTLRSDADFEAFCIDFFPSVQARFTTGMDRVVKMNLLLERVENLNEILRALRQKELVNIQLKDHDIRKLLAPNKHLTIWVISSVVLSLIALLSWSVYRNSHPLTESPSSQRFSGSNLVAPPPAPKLRHRETRTYPSAAQKAEHQQTNEVSAVDIHSGGDIKIQIYPNSGSNRLSVEKIKADGDVNIGVMGNSASKESK